MADRMAAEIWIGGKLPRSLLDEFPISDLRLDWDATPLDSTSEQRILSAREESGLLHFADCEAAWGEFEELEGWLREHNIPFKRHSSGKYEYLPETVEFRPDLGEEIQTMTTDSGEPLVSKSDLAPILEEMTRLQRSKRPLDAQVRAWKRLSDKLVKLVPPTLPALPPFEIVDGKAPVAREQEVPEAATCDDGIARLVDKAEAAGLEPEDLDELVHELAASIAADVNNGGFDDQIGYLVDGMGVQQTERQLDDLIEGQPKEEGE